MKLSITVDSSEVQTILEALGRHAQRAMLLSQADGARATTELQRRIKSQAHDQMAPKYDLR